MTILSTKERRSRQQSSALCNRLYLGSDLVVVLKGIAAAADSNVSKVVRTLLLSAIEGIDEESVERGNEAYWEARKTHRTPKEDRSLYVAWARNTFDPKIGNRWRPDSSVESICKIGWTSAQRLLERLWVEGVIDRKDRRYRVSAKAKTRLEKMALGPLDKLLRAESSVDTHSACIDLECSHELAAVAIGAHLALTRAAEWEEEGQRLVILRKWGQVAG